MENSKMMHVIIGFKRSPLKSDIELVTKLGGSIKRKYRIIDAVSADIPEDKLDTIKKDPNVEYIEIDEKLFAHIPIGVCQEVRVLKQMIPWGINRIGSRFVNALGNTGKGIKIAILDTGIDKNHEDLAGNFKGGYNVVGDNTDLTDLNGHGSHIAGTIGALDNDIGVVGVAPESSLYSVKVLDFAASGTASDLVAGIEWSVENNMHIINMSLGSDENSISFQRSISHAYNSGVLLVAAAGNSGNFMGTGDNIDYPSKYNTVISVGATDIKDDRAKFSSTGPRLEISAPGVDIPSTLPNNKYGTLSGTSMAAPHVTGVSALIMKAYPNMTNTEVRIRLQISAQNITKNGSISKKDWYGYGLVDAVKSVSL